MGNINIGNNEVSAVYLGANEILRVYLGNEIIYDKRALDISTQALLDKANTLGYSTPTNIYALDDLIKGMKTIEMWGLLDVFYIFASDLGAYPNFRLLNVVNPDNFEATGYGGLEWTSAGVKGNGVNTYIDTNFTPSVDAINYNGNKASRGAVVHVNASGSALNNYLIDASQATPQTNALFNNSDITVNQNRINTTQSGGIVGNYRGLGLKVINRTSNEEFNSINRDSMESFTNTGIIVLNTQSQHIFRNTTGYSQIGISCYFIGEDIPNSTAQNFRTIFNNYLTSIGQTAVA